MLPNAFLAMQVYISGVLTFKFMLVEMILLWVEFAVQLNLIGWEPETVVQLMITYWCSKRHTSVPMVIVALCAVGEGVEIMSGGLVLKTGGKPRNIMTKWKKT